MRRAYGSDIPDLIDAPINGETVVDLYQAVAESVGQWEPRLILTRVQVLAATPGHLTLALDGEVTGRAISVNVEVAA